MEQDISRRGFIGLMGKTFVATAVSGGVIIELTGCKGKSAEVLSGERVITDNAGREVQIPTVFTAPPKVLEAFNKTEYAARLKATGVITSYICPLMYMNNPLCKKMPVITSSNKLRTYTTARYYTDDEILLAITKGVN